MSYLNRYLQRSIDDLKVNKTWSRDVTGFIDDWWHTCALMHFWYKIKWVWINRWLFKHIWSHRTYSAEFSIELFCDSLRQQVIASKPSRSVSAQKDYRRCIYGAELLRRAFITNYEGRDKSLCSLRNRNPTKMVEVQGTNMYRIETKFANSEQYYDKMYKIIHDRIQKEINQKRREAWNYINKYFYKFGD